LKFGISALLTLFGAFAAEVFFESEFSADLASSELAERVNQLLSKISTNFVQIFGKGRILK